MADPTANSGETPGVEKAPWWRFSAEEEPEPAVVHLSINPDSVACMSGGKNLPRSTKTNEVTCRSCQRTMQHRKRTEAASHNEGKKHVWSGRNGWTGRAVYAGPGDTVYHVSSPEPHTLVQWHPKYDSGQIQAADGSQRWVHRAELGVTPYQPWQPWSANTDGPRYASATDDADPTREKMWEAFKGYRGVLERDGWVPSSVNDIGQQEGWYKNFEHDDQKHWTIYTHPNLSPPERWHLWQNNVYPGEYYRHPTFMSLWDHYKSLDQTPPINFYSPDEPMEHEASANPEEGIEFKAAGIAVIAMDTGRVLMLQRALNPVTCPCGQPVTWDEQNGYQHDDGSVDHDQDEFAGQTVSDLLDAGHPLEKEAAGDEPWFHERKPAILAPWPTDGPINDWQTENDRVPDWRRTVDPDHTEMMNPSGDPLMELKSMEDAGPHHETEYSGGEPCHDCWMTWNHTQPQPPEHFEWTGHTPMEQARYAKVAEWFHQRKPAIETGETVPYLMDDANDSNPEWMRIMDPDYKGHINPSGDAFMELKSVLDSGGANNISHHGWPCENCWLRQNDIRTYPAEHFMETGHKPLETPRYVAKTAGADVCPSCGNIDQVSHKAPAEEDETDRVCGSCNSAWQHSTGAAPPDIQDAPDALAKDAGFEDPRLSPEHSAEWEREHPGMHIRRYEPPLDPSMGPEYGLIFANDLDYLAQGERSGNGHGNGLIEAKPIAEYHPNELDEEGNPAGTVHWDVPYYSPTRAGPVCKDCYYGTGKARTEAQHNNEMLYHRSDIDNLQSQHDDNPSNETASEIAALEKKIHPFSPMLPEPGERRLGALQTEASLEYDKNEGVWEFPGGCLEPGEQPRAAAIREFAEEVGQALPPGVFVGAWLSPGGITVAAGTQRPMVGEPGTWGAVPSQERQRIADEYGHQYPTRQLNLDPRYPEGYATWTDSAFPITHKDMYRGLDQPMVGFRSTQEPSAETSADRYEYSHNAEPMCAEHYQRHGLMVPKSTHDLYEFDHPFTPLVPEPGEKRFGSWNADRERANGGSGTPTWNETGAFWLRPDEWSDWQDEQYDDNTGRTLNEEHTINQPHNMVAWEYRPGLIPSQGHPWPEESERLPSDQDVKTNVVRPPFDIKDDDEHRLDDGNAMIKKWKEGDGPDPLHHEAAVKPVYKGFIYLIQNEKDLDLASNRGIVNPDDPDGDMTEQCAWWDIEDAKNNPALRPECQGTPWDELALWADKSVRANRQVQAMVAKMVKTAEEWIAPPGYPFGSQYDESEFPWREHVKYDESAPYGPEEGWVNASAFGKDFLYRRGRSDGHHHFIMPPDKNTQMWRYINTKATPTMKFNNAGAAMDYGNFLVDDDDYDLDSGRKIPPHEAAIADDAEGYEPADYPRPLREDEYDLLTPETDPLVSERSDLVFGTPPETLPQSQVSYSKGPNCATCYDLGHNVAWQPHSRVVQQLGLPPHDFADIRRESAAKLSAKVTVDFSEMLTPSGDGSFTHQVSIPHQDPTFNNVYTKTYPSHEAYQAWQQNPTLHGYGGPRLQLAKPVQLTSEEQEEDKLPVQPVQEAEADDPLAKVRARLKEVRGLPQDHPDKIQAKREYQQAFHSQYTRPTPQNHSETGRRTRQGWKDWEADNPGQLHPGHAADIERKRRARRVNGPRELVAPDQLPPPGRGGRHYASEDPYEQALAGDESKLPREPKLPGKEDRVRQGDPAKGEQWWEYNPKTAMSLDRFSQQNMAFPDHEDGKAVYARFGDWPANERSMNHIFGQPEEGVSVYDLDKEGNPLDPDSAMDRGFHYSPDDDEEEPEQDPDFRDDTHGMLQDHIAEARRGHNLRPNSRAHLVRGQLNGFGHDDEPVLGHLETVGHWPCDVHKFIPGMSEPAEGSYGKEGKWQNGKYNWCEHPDHEDSDMEYEASVRSSGGKAPVSVELVERGVPKAASATRPWWVYAE